MEHKLIELINIDKSKILIENFSKVVGMPMALLDMQGNVLIGENRCSVYKNFYSKSKDAGKKCDDFHNSMVEKLKNLDDYIVYKCCHNLMNAVIPICIKNTQVANLIVAEFFHEKPDMEFYMTEAKKYGLDEEKYLKFISSIPVISKKETNHIVDFVLSLANILAGLVLQRMQVIQEAEAHKQTQKEAHKSQTLFRALFRGAAEGILIADVETKKFKYANPTICKMLGYTEEELIIKNVSDIHPKNKLKHVIEEFEAQARGEKVCAPNIPCLRKDGSIVYADIYTSPISIGGREYNVGFFADITERKAAEEALRISEEHLRLKLDTLLSPDVDIDDYELSNILDAQALQSILEDFSKLTGMGTAILDLKGNILVATGWQDICTKFHRVHPDTKRACIKSDIYFTANIEPDEFTVYKCHNHLWDMATPLIIGDKHVGNIYAGQFFYEGEVVDRQVFIDQADKYGFDKESYLAALDNVSRVSREKAESVMKCLAKFSKMISKLSFSNVKLAKAINKQKCAEKALRVSEERFRTIYENAPVMINSFDETGRCVLWNKQCVGTFGWTIDEINAHGDILSSIYHNPSVSEEAIRTIIAKPDGCFKEWHSLTKEGNTLTTMWANFRLPDGTGISLGYDITERKEAEKEIYDSQQALLEAQKIAHIGNWDYYYNTDKLYWSDELFSIYGIEKQDINLEFMVSIMHPDDKKFGLEILNTFIKGEVDNFELGFRVICLDGIMRHIYSKGKLIFDEHCKPIKAMGIVQDITELKQAEIMSHLQRDLAYELSSINNVQTALDALLKATMKIEYIDGGGVYIVNEETGELDLISHIGLSDKFIKNVLHYPPDAPNTKMIMQGKAIYSSVMNLPPEVQPVLKKEKLRAMAIVPVMYENKTVAALNLASRTIDEIPQNERDIIESISTQIGTIMVRIKAEEALRISERRFREIIEKSNDAICVIQDLDFVLINPKCTELFEYTEEEALSSNYEILDVIDEESKKFVQIIIDRRDEEDYFPLHFQFKAKSKSGKKIDCDVTISEIEWDNKKAVLCFVRDMTVQNRLEAQLQQAQKMETIGRLAGGIAHDFNNLLTAIIGNAELGMLDLNKNDPLYDEFNDIMKTASRAANLTRQLLAFGRRQVLSPKIIDLNKIVIDMDKMLRRIIGSDIRFSTMTSKSIWNIKADASQIEQIVVNLVVNARDAMENGGDLSIETKNIVVDDKFYKIYNFTDIPHGQYAMISITDTGKGMEEQLLENVFEPFFTTKKLGAGTGLGLATVYGIVKQSQGYIQVNSKIGKGTSFKVYFPAQKDQQVEPITKNKLSNNLSGNETVLIVEDNDAVRQIAIRILKNYGYDVLDVSNAEDAITLCKNFNKKISIVVTDIVMPEINGIQMIKLLREIKDDFKVLYVSGYTKLVVTEEGLLKSGANYLQKPFKPHQLAKAIRDILNR